MRTDRRLGALFSVTSRTFVRAAVNNLRSSPLVQFRVGGRVSVNPTIERFGRERLVPYSAPLSKLTDVT